MSCKRKRERRGHYVVTRVTTIVETCHVGMPTKKLAEQWAKSSDATRVEHTTGWRGEKYVPDP